MHIAPLTIRVSFLAVVLALRLLATPAFAQVTDFPTGELAEPDRAEIVVVDRYRVPVAYADVDVRFARFGAVLGMRTDGDLWTEIPGLVTGADGRVSFALPPNALAIAQVSRPGYATRMVRSIAPGHRYECLLQVGGRAVFRCRDASGAPVADAELRMFWWDDPNAEAQRIFGSEPLTSRSDHEGTAAFFYVPTGQLDVIAESPTAGVAHASLQYFGSTGRDRYLSLEDVPLVFEEPFTTSVRVVDQEGAAVVGLDAQLWGGLHQYSRPAPRVDGAEVAIGPVARDLAMHLQLRAPGFERVDLRLVPTERQETVTLVRRPTTTWHYVEPEPAERNDERPERVVLYPSDPYDGLRPLTGDERGDYVFGASPGPGPKAVVLRDGAIVAYLCASGDGASEGVLRRVEAASLEVRYTVGGVPPIGAFVPIRLREPFAQVGRVGAGVGSFMARTDSAGVLHIDGLLPGTYDLTPNFHFAVHGESQLEVRLAPGDVVAREVAVSAGQVVRGVVRDAATGKPAGGGYVVHHSAELGEGFPFCPLDRDGRFLITGLKEGVTYSITYWDAPWPQGSSGPAYWPRMDENVRTATISVDVSTETPPVEIEVE
ncbi:MAG: hypothetical protein R3F34_05620 [Planctomycetota bacterium]